MLQIHLRLVLRPRTVRLRPEREGKTDKCLSDFYLNQLRQEPSEIASTSFKLIGQLGPWLGTFSGFVEESLGVTKIRID